MQKVIDMAEDKRPNILLIMADDMERRDFGFLGGNVHSPTLDKLADEGIYFRQAHVPTAICSPSRYTLLTGLDPSRSSKVNGFAYGQRFWTQFPHGVDAVYISEMLREAGYNTGIVGKTHGMATQDLPYADRLDSLDNLGFDYAASIYRFRGSDWIYHNQEWVTEGALNFLEQSQSSSDNQPFFLYMAVTLLHGPNAMDEMGGLAETPDWDDEILTSTPATRAGEIDPNAQVTLEETISNREAIRNQVIQEGKPLESAPVTWLDDGIGRVMQKLEELNIAEDTLVIFLNDNGVEGGKFSVYELGTNVPLMMYWKGKTETLADSKTYAQSYDIAPTILELAQATPPPEIEFDGQSLVPILEGAQDIPGRDYAYTAIGHTRSVTKDGWKYVAFRVPEDLDPEDTSPLNKPIADVLGYTLKKYPYYLDSDQLYNLKTDLNDLDDVSSPNYDPYEEVNLAQRDRRQDKLIELQTLLAQHLIDLPGSFGEFKWEVTSSRSWQVDGDLDLSAPYNGIALKDGDVLSRDEYLVIRYSGELLGEFEFDQTIEDLGYKVDYTTPGQVKLIKLNSSSGQEIIGGSDNDVLTGGTGNDTISGNGGNDNIRGNAGADVLDGGNGQDSLDYRNADSGVNINLATGAARGSDAEGDTISNFEKVLGSNSDDTIEGDRSNNWLRGFGGNDTIIGSEGNDNIQGDAGADVLDGGEGKDSLNYRSANGGVNVNLATGAARGSDAEGDTISNFEKVLGSNFGDNLQGDRFNNTLQGFAGNDTIAGNEGNDNIRGDAGADVLDGGGGKDSLDYRSADGGVNINLATGAASGSDANGDTISNFEKVLGSNFGDILKGDSTNNLLKGFDGKDNLDGGAGNDNIHGGKDGDILTGGDGSDIFSLSKLIESLWADFDVITDFDTESDRLDAPTAISADKINDFGNLSEFTATAITQLLASLSADNGAIFNFDSRTFVAINDNLAGFNVSADALIEITNYTGDIRDLVIQ